MSVDLAILVEQQELVPISSDGGTDDAEEVIFCKLSLERGEIHHPSEKLKKIRPTLLSFGYPSVHLYAEYWQLEYYGTIPVKQMEVKSLIGKLKLDIFCLVEIKVTEVILRR